MKSTHWNKRRVGLAVWALIGWMAAGSAVAGETEPASQPAQAAEQDLAKDLTAAQTAVYAVQAPVVVTTSSGSEAKHHALKVTAWVDRPDNTYAVGEKVGLTVQSNRDAYITVFNVGASGQTVQLFPNALQPDNRAMANQPLVITSVNTAASFQVGGPVVGAELIKIIASTTPQPLVGQGKVAGSVGPFLAMREGGAGFARDLQVTMSGNEPAVAVATIAAEPAPAPVKSVATYNKIIKTIMQRTQAVPVVQAMVPGVIMAPAAAPSQNTAFGMVLMTDKPAYRVGETMRVTVTPHQDCYLTLINVAATGQAWMLFPNQAMRNNLIPANQTFSLPGSEADLAIHVQGPPGPENILAVCTTQNQPVLARAVDYSQMYPSVGTVETVNRDLSVVATSQPANSISQTSVTFSVMP